MPLKSDAAVCVAATPSSPWPAEKPKGEPKVLRDERAASTFCRGRRDHAFWQLNRSG